jgi:hypothetical protein
MDMAQRYQYGWMDDSTDVFAGFPIDVISKYVTEGRVEEETVDAFNADIDYLMLNPTNVARTVSHYCAVRTRLEDGARR